MMKARPEKPIFGPERIKPASDEVEVKPIRSILKAASWRVVGTIDTFFLSYVIITYLGPAFVSMITGSVIIDVYFTTGGIGKSFVDSALNRDYAVMMGVTILLGTLTILFNLVVDIIYGWIDPKIRY